MPRHTLRLFALVLLLLLPACRSWQAVPLGGAGRRVDSVSPGTAVDLRFAAPRRLTGLPQPVARVRGTVARTRADTLFVHVGEFAALGGRLQPVERDVTTPVIVDRDVAVQLREPSRRRLALVALGVAGVVAAVVLTQ